MPSNDFDINTDDYDLYNSQGVPSALPGTPIIDGSGHLEIPRDPYFSPSTLENSTMDKDPRNTGPTTDFWNNYPLTIDINGYIFYYNENTGINIRGPEGAPQYVSFDSLTPEQIATLKGRDGADGVNGRDGTNGTNGTDGLDAYHLWLRDNGYTEQDHPIEDFYQYLAGYIDIIVKEGTGTGSIVANFNGEENIASGRGSFAAGYGTTAAGELSATFGNHTQTNSMTQGQFVIGRYNKGLPGNAFEIGNGTSVSNRSNCFEITLGGSVFAGGEITDGYNNTLSDKVDKIEGKGLSTYDFTAVYKNFIDNYTIENAVVQSSNNPVTSAGIYYAIEQAKASVASKPTIEAGTADLDFPLISYIPVGSDQYFERGVKLNSFTYNPDENNVKIGNGISTNSKNNVFGFGIGLDINSNNQVVIGKYNAPSSNDIFQIGWGTAANATANIFSIGKNGNVLAAGEITDGTGNILSHKQDTLSWDSTIVSGGTNPVTSGTIYNALTSVGIYPYDHIEISGLTNLQQQVNTMSSSLTSLSTRVTTLENTKYEITDDITDEVYLIGISNGELYIRLKDEPEPEEEEEEGDET